MVETDDIPKTAPPELTNGTAREHSRVHIACGVVGAVALILLILLGIGCVIVAAVYNGPNGTDESCTGEYRKRCLDKCLCAYCLPPNNSSELGYCVRGDDSDDCVHGLETARYGKTCEGRLRFLEVVSTAAIVLFFIFACGACGVLAGDTDPPPIARDKARRRQAARRS